MIEAAAPTPRAKLGALLALCRVSNLPTVWMNVLTALVLSGAGTPLPTFLLLVGLPRLGAGHRDHPMDVRVGELQHLPAGGAGPAGLHLPGGGADQALGQPEPQPLLADPRRTHEQHQLRQAVGLNGLRESSPEFGVAGQGGDRHSRKVRS